MTIDRSRRRFLMGGAALGATLVVGTGAIAQDGAGRKITVYKNPT